MTNEEIIEATVLEVAARLLMKLPRGTDVDLLARQVVPLSMSRAIREIDRLRAQLPPVHLTAEQKMEGLG